MNTKIFTEQLDRIVKEYDAVVRSAKYDDLSDIAHGKIESLSVLISKAKAAIARISGINSQYFKEIDRAIESRNHEGTKLRLIIGTVKALREDIEHGYLKTFEDLIQADVFSNYLEMGEYILKEVIKTLPQ